MLRFLRDRSKKLVVHMVFWPIILVFVIWGFENFGNPLGGAAAVVNGETITMTEYRTALQRMIDFYTQMMQGKFDAKAQKQFRVKEMALRQLIQQHAISEEAKSMGLGVSDEEVLDTITKIPFLQKEGRFSPDNYNAMLNYSRMTANQFENRLRRDALIQKTRELFEKNVAASPSEIAMEKEADDLVANVSFVKINRKALEGGINVSSKEVDIFVNDPANKTKLKSYYDLNKHKYSKGEQAQAKHILIKAKKGDAQAEAKAMKTIKEIKKDLTASNFSEKAKKYSEDPGSKSRGGDLGLFERGRMVPEFEKAAFDGEVGKISEPVQTSYGYHLILPLKKVPANSRDLKSVERDIAKVLISQQRVDDAIKSVEKDLTEKGAKALSPLRKLGANVKWEETGSFSVGADAIPKIGANEDVFQAVAGLTKEKPVAPKLLRVGSDLYALQRKEVKKKPDEKKNLPNSLAAPGRGLYTSWSSGIVEKAKVQTNPLLLENPQQ